MPALTYYLNDAMGNRLLKTDSYTYLVAYLFNRGLNVRHYERNADTPVVFLSL